MDKIDLKALSAAERAELMQQLAEETKLEQERLRKEREAYEAIKDEVVRKTFVMLQEASDKLLEVKEQVYQNFEQVMALKKELFNLSDEQLLTQGSHTFTSSDGVMSVIIGSNIIDRWDETVSVGIELINKWLDTLARDEKSAQLVGIVRDLLKPNKDGVLKASRVLDLSKHADRIGDKELIKAVNIIRDAYRPAKTSTYVKAKCKDATDKDQYIPLSMSAV
ncbi:MAG: DUF3164 family protein [Bacteroidales bacterium]|jgi:hypothetical protein|nr:DUF3164 family protein [Bacteroidales bacterium]HOI31199.1 DUF3164 family protein [Bacteroidales bacterium]